MTVFDDDLHNHEPDEFDSLANYNFYPVNQKSHQSSSSTASALHDKRILETEDMKPQTNNNTHSSLACNVTTSEITSQLVHTDIGSQYSNDSLSKGVIYTENNSVNNSIHKTRNFSSADSNNNQKIYSHDNIMLNSDDVIDGTTTSGVYEQHEEQQNRLLYNDFEAKLTQQLLENAEESLKELYEIHDYYFTADKEEKLEMLKERCHKVLLAIDKIQQEHPMVYEQLSSSKRGRLAYIQGRAFDVFEAYNMEAETALTRAVKLNPTDVDAWNGLAHCFWKKRDFSSAYDCYKQALENQNNKISHREFSKLLRQLPTENNVDAANNVKESLDHAKAAIKLDLLDPDSWFVLGNAHLSLFFKVSPNVDDLSRALQAYRRAEANGGDYNPDLFFNRANVLRYKEELDEAIVNYLKAHELDAWLKTSRDLTLVDVREEQELAIAPFPHTVTHLPLSKAEGWMGEINSQLSGDGPVVVICHAGVRSWNFGCWLLQQQPSREVWNLEGGIDAWSVMIDPSVPRY